MFTQRFTQRAIAGTAAATAAIVMAAGPAAAAVDQGPYVFDSAGSGQAVSVVVNLPAEVADGLAPILDSLPGINIEGSSIVISLADVVSQLALPLVNDAPGVVDSLASATSVGGTLEGLVASLAGESSLSCIGTPIDVSIPPDAATPLIAFDLLTADCVEDAEGRQSIAYSRVANLEVNLAGALALLPAEISAPVEDAVDQISVAVEDQILKPLIDNVVTPLQDQVNDMTGIGLDIREALRVPELIDVPLVRIKLIEATTESVTDGDLIRNISTTTLAGAQLLGTVCMSDVTYRAESFATGEPGGNDFKTSIPLVELGICDTSNLNPILQLLESDGVINDVLVNLGGGELRPLADTLRGIGLPTDDLFGALEELLATLGVSTIVQGYETDGYRTADGREAGVAIDPLRVVVAPLSNLAAGTPLEALGVEIRYGTISSGVAAAPAPPPPPCVPGAPECPHALGVDPAVAPTPDVSLPRTGGGALAAIAGIMALGSAATLRRRR